MPYRHLHETHVVATPAQLFAAITDLRRWPEWDPELVSNEHDGTPLAVGSRFTLRPKGGPKVAMQVAALDEPRRFADVALLPLARIRTIHEFEPEQAGGTRVRVIIETTGPLAFLWERLVARKLAKDAAPHTQAFAEFARRSYSKA